MLTNDAKEIVGTAYHEVGHVVAYYHLGKPFKYVSINGNSPLVQPSKLVSDQYRSERLFLQSNDVENLIAKEAIILLSGLVAESIYLQLDWIKNKDKYKSILSDLEQGKMDELTHKVIKGALLYDIKELFSFITDKKLDIDLDSLGLRNANPEFFIKGTDFESLELWLESWNANSGAKRRNIDEEFMAMMEFMVMMVLMTKVFIDKYWTDIDSIVPELLEKEQLTEQEVKNLIQQAGQHGS